MINLINKTEQGDPGSALFARFEACSQQREMRSNKHKWVVSVPGCGLTYAGKDCLAKLAAVTPGFLVNLTDSFGGASLFGGLGLDCIGSFPAYLAQGTPKAACSNELCPMISVPRTDPCITSG